VLVFGVSWAVGWFFLRQQWLPIPVYAGTAVLLHFMLIYFVLLQACRAPAEDQRSGVLEILLTTPLGDDAYVKGRMLALKRQCFWPVLLVVAVDFGLAAAGSSSANASNWEWLVWMGATAVFVLRSLIDLYTLSWVGMWQGLKVVNAGRAIRKTIWYVFIWRWLIFLALLAFLGVLTQGRAYQTALGGVVAAVGYLSLPLLSLQYLGQGLSEVKDDLRLLALGGGNDAEFRVGGRSVPAVAKSLLQIRKASA
jgi:hypothetical protein